MIGFLSPSSTFGRFIAASLLLIIFLLPIGVKIYLNAGIGYLPLVLIILAVGAPGLLNRIYNGEYPWLRYISAIAGVILAVSILVGILITPLSAYVYWFESFKSGSQQGEVGTIFVLLITLVTAITSPMVWKMGILWPFFIVSIVILYLLTVIVQTSVSLIILILILAVSSIYYLARLARSGPGIANVAFAVVLIVISLITAIFVPDISRATGNRFVSETLHPALRNAVTQVLPRFSLLYAVPGYGMSFSETNLGERPQLLDTPIFEIEGSSGEQYYFRTRVFDEYNGTSWSMSQHFADRYFDNPAGAGFLSTGSRPSGELLSVTITSKGFSYIPYTLDTKRIYVEGEYPPLMGGSESAGFGLAGPFEQGTRLYLEPYRPGELNSESLNPRERSDYLQIPDDLPNELRSIAFGLSRDTASKPEILAKIEAFLAYNYTYTLDVDEYIFDQAVPSSADFAYSFLFSESGGYCVHFATSFILLARLSGIPARYATGYLTAIPVSETKAIATGLSAHAWPEVWLDGIGWVNWEATPAANADNYTVFGDEWYFNLDIDLDQATAEQLEGLLGREIRDRFEAPGSDGNRSLAIRLLIIILSSLVGTAFLVVVTLRFVYPGLRYIADRRGRFYHSMKRFSRRLERKGVPGPTRAGWLAWGTDVKRLIGANGSSDTIPVDEMIRVLLGLTYGDEEFLPETTHYFDSFRKHVRKEIRSRSKRQSRSAV